MKQPNKHFSVTAKQGDAPVSIIADTLIDAQCQARELSDGMKPFDFRELPLDYISYAQLSQLNESMKHIFS